MSCLDADPSAYFKEFSSAIKENNETYTEFLLRLRRIYKKPHNIQEPTAHDQELTALVQQFLQEIHSPDSRNLRLIATPENMKDIDLQQPTKRLENYKPVTRDHELQTFYQ